MPILLQCPACGQQYRLQDTMAGKTAKCKCGQVINVPLPRTDAGSALEEVLNAGPSQVGAPSSQPNPQAGGGFMPPGAGFRPTFKTQTPTGSSSKLVLWLALGSVG